MNDWFSWNDTRCTEYGIHISEQPPLTIPSERVTYTNVPGRPGSLTTLEGEDVYDDLVLTATSDLSRNFRYGRALGAGEEFDAAITVEGASTAQAARVIARDRGIAMPIADAVAALAQGRASVADTVVELLQRPLKEE